MQLKEYQRTNESQAGDGNSDVIVVGGGLAGLAAATYAGRAGRTVTLFDKSGTLGGRAESQERAGFILNLGAHALYEKSAAIQVLRELGVEYTGGNPRGVRAMSQGTSYLAPADTASLLKTGLLSPSEKWEASLLLLKLMFADTDKLASVSVSDWLRKEGPHEEVRRVMETTARVTTYTNAPERLSAGGFAKQLQIVSKGKVIYVDGGWQTLVDGLQQAARRAGVRIVTGARVEAVIIESGRAAGVRLADGTTHRAGSVILALGPREAAQLVEGQEESPLSEWAENAVPVKAACLDVVLKRLPEPRNAVVFDVERPLFLTVQSQFSNPAANGQRGGGALAYALKYLDPFAPQDPAADRQELERWLDDTQPGWREEVVESRFLPHLVVSNAMVDASRGGQAGRPGPDVPGVRDLYVAGDWVGPVGQLAAASLWSGREAAQAVIASPALAEVA